MILLIIIFLIVIFIIIITIILAIIFMNNKKDMNNHWSILHKKAVKHDGSDDNVFLRFWESGIPNYSGHVCRCKMFYYNWKSGNPPDFQNYFEWSVKLHNAVNEKLNKPTMDLEQARQLWLNN